MSMKKVGGKVDSGSAMGDKGIPPGVSTNGANDVTKKVDSPGTWSGGKALVPPTKGAGSKPNLKDGTLD